MRRKKEERETVPQHTRGRKKVRKNSSPLASFLLSFFLHVEAFRAQGAEEGHNSSSPLPLVSTGALKRGLKKSPRERDKGGQMRQKKGEERGNPRSLLCSEDDNEMRLRPPGPDSSSITLTFFYTATLCKKRVGTRREK